MNPNSGETPHLNLPPPMEGAAEHGPLTTTPESQLETAPGSAASPERASAPPADTPSPFHMPAAAQPVATPLAQTDDTAAPASKSSSSKLIKDDDLIEKEWVDKAKRIVEQTRDDPHRQSEQLTMVKADYMKKQYNKTIKVNK